MTTINREPKIISARVVGPKLGEHQAIEATEQWWSTRSTYGDDWEYVTEWRGVVFCLCKGALQERVPQNVGSGRLPFLEHVVASWYEETA